MKDIIANFSKQIEDAITIGEDAILASRSEAIDQILVCGLGGSGIGGKIVSLLLERELKVPFLTVNDYEIPEWVNENTLVIASSYSGNTEETLSAIEACANRGAEIAVITSGGKLADLSKENGWNLILIPGGQQPRAMLSYSLVQQIYLLSHYGLISHEAIDQLKRVSEHLDSEEEVIRKQAETLAGNIYSKTIIIYAGSLFEGVAVRFRQQINENGKELCWHHILPEMTHNELVGWAGGSEQFAPIFISSGLNHPRTQKRWEICKGIIKKYTSNVFEIESKGENLIEQVFYTIHFTDWVSLYISEIKKIDPIEVDVISHLKSEMSRIKE
ncbi:bifunctional phosphoglucose/phosphomannose isomerase [Crocinitomix catalasitica]|nr:bifunctional phosphoglucose/phosphomannose isomerase [Crocinitomix catalasitica]